MRISDWSSDVCSADLDDGIGILQNIRRRHAQDAIAVLDHEGVATFVTTMPITPFMRLAIHLHDQMRPRTVEIGDIGTNRVLLAEFQPGLRALYPLPDQDFGQGQFATKLARGVHFGPRSEEHTSELQSLMRISYAVFCLKKKNTNSQDRNNKRHK